MNYIKESRKAYLERNIEGFAYELYLLNKYQNKNDVTIKVHLREFLETGFILTDSEETRIIELAIKMAEERFGIEIEGVT